MQTINFGFRSTVLLFIFSLAPFWAFQPLSRPFGATHGNNLLETYQCRISTLVLEIQPYLFISIPPIWSHFVVFGPLEYYFGWSQVQKKFLDLILQTINFGFGVQPYLFFYLAPFGAFLPFLGPSGYYLGWGQVPKIFWDLTMQTINFGFGSTALSFFYQGPFGTLFALFGPFEAILGVGSSSAKKLDLLMQNITFGFGSKALSFYFQFCPILGLFCPFQAVQSFFGVGVRSKNFFGTYSHRLITFVL